MLVKLKFIVSKHWNRGETSFVFDIESSCRNLVSDISIMTFNKYNHSRFSDFDNSICTKKWIEREDYIKYLEEMRNFLDGEAYN